MVTARTAVWTKAERVSPSTYLVTQHSRDVLSKWLLHFQLRHGTDRASRTFALLENHIFISILLHFNLLCQHAGQQVYAI